MTPAVRVHMPSRLHSDPPTPTAATPRDSAGGIDISWATRGTARGDTAAFEALYRAWFDRVYALARGITKRDEAFCLDVTQEVMLRAAKRLPELSCEGQLAVWFSRTAVSVAVDMIRSERCAINRAQRATTPAAEREGPDIDDLAWLSRSLRSVTVVDLSLLMQRIGHGATLREAAASVGIGSQAAHGRVRRALDRLRSMAREVLP